MEVSDLTVQVNQEKALRLELESRLAQGPTKADGLKTQLDAQKEMTAQCRELYQSMAAKGSTTHSQSQSQKGQSTPMQGCPFWVFSPLAPLPSPH